MNGFSTGEEDSRGPTDQTCCLIDSGDRCTKAAGNASYSKRIQKTVTQRRLNLGIDNSVSTHCFDLIIQLNLMFFQSVTSVLCLMQHCQHFLSIICRLCNGGSNFLMSLQNCDYYLYRNIHLTFTNQYPSRCIIMISINVLRFSNILLILRFLKLPAAMKTMNFLFCACFYEFLNHFSSACV